MIRYIQGTVFQCTQKNIILFTSGGVGYHVFPSGSVFALAQKDKPLSLFISMVVKENEISLYGFSEESELTLFEKLISISGIGPKTALQMLSIPVQEFLRAIDQGDVLVLTRVPGLGKKTAERLIIELRGKIDLSSSSQVPPSPAEQEALDALQNLGYDERTIRSVLSQADNHLSAEDLVTYFLSSHG